MKSVALIVALAAVALAQHWDIEQVDSAGWGASVEMRWHPDGRLFLCYSNASGTIRLASKDSVWHCESVPTAGQPVSETQAFDIDRRGDIGVSYMGNDGYYWYALKTGAGWTDAKTPFHYGFPSPSTLDTAGLPAITTPVGDALVLARLRDTSWVTDTLVTGDPQWNPFFGGCALGSRADGVVWGVFWYSYSWPDRDPHGEDLFSFYAGDSGVAVNAIAGGDFDALGGASGCVDRRGFVHSCYAYQPMGDSVGLYLDQTQIDNVWVERTALKFDSLDRPQIAYVPSDGGLMYRYLGPEGWHIFDMQTTGVTALSLIIGENSQPLIAYTTSAGVFLAHGVDVAGQSEEASKPQAASLKPQATVVRGVLRVPVSLFTIHTSLFDMTGRQVMALHPGANDVSGLAPGVYFVREKPQAPSLKPQAVRKVVIQR